MLEKIAHKNTLKSYVIPFSTVSYNSIQDNIVKYPKVVHDTGQYII